MRVLITGNMGYVGPVLASHLRVSHPEITLAGFDTGYFAHCLTAAGGLPERVLQQQVFGDIRRLPPDLLQGVDAVVHLAGISNDPIGTRYSDATNQINHEASLALARQAKAAGAGVFVFASSCSMYGAADESPRVESDPLNPLTAYARSKVRTEEGLVPLADDGFSVTSLRFSTACGMSPRLRLDLVLNDFVAGAVAENRITILSDGKPWRPLIDVQDMARAVDWALHRRVDQGGPYVAVNVGSQGRNYQVLELAEAVAAEIPGTEVSVNPDAEPDERSYKVDFSRFQELAPGHQPRVSLEESIRNLKQGLLSMRFQDRRFRESHLMRLKVLDSLVSQGLLDTALYWTR
jgi:nucleoside-diphosphate-sugar epimerase